jgi:hypothetical protein
MLANPRQVLAILQFVAATRFLVGKLKNQMANSDLSYCSNSPKSYLNRFPTIENMVLDTKSLKIGQFLAKFAYLSKIGGESI